MHFHAISLWKQAMVSGAPWRNPAARLAHLGSPDERQPLTTKNEPRVFVRTPHIVVCARPGVAWGDTGGILFHHGGIGSQRRTYLTCLSPPIPSVHLSVSRSISLSTTTRPRAFCNTTCLDNNASIVTHSLNPVHRCQFLLFPVIKEENPQSWLA